MISLLPSSPISCRVLPASVLLLNTAHLFLPQSDTGRLPRPSWAAPAWLTPEAGEVASDHGTSQTSEVKVYDVNDTFRHPFMTFSDLSLDSGEDIPMINGEYILLKSTT